MGDLLKMNSARSVIWKQIVAATRGNGREAPRADLYATSSRLPQQTLSSQCCIEQRERCLFRPRWTEKIRRSKAKTRKTDAERLKATDAVGMLATAKLGLAAMAQVKQAMH
jgi:hypothetical protein